MSVTLDSRAPKADLAMSCTLRRNIGSPISAQTIEIGPRGMQVRSRRPMSLDEIVGFELPDLGMRVSGRARVLRVERANVYALRFEGLPEPMVRRLHALAITQR
jgi:PilZ domain